MSDRPGHWVVENITAQLEQPPTVARLVRFMRANDIQMDAQLDYGDCGSHEIDLFWSGGAPSNLDAEQFRGTCWCFGEVGKREPGDVDGYGCLLNVHHNWRGGHA